MNIFADVVIVSIVCVCICVCVCFVQLFQMEFEYPLFIIILGTLGTFFGSALMVGSGGYGALQWPLLREHWGLIACFSLIHAVDIGMENVSIVYISIGLNQVIKVSSTAFTMLLACCVEGHRYSAVQIFAAHLCIVGAILSTLTNPEFDKHGAWGVAAACISSVSGAASTVVLSLLLQRCAVTPLTIATATSLLSVIALVRSPSDRLAFFSLLLYTINVLH